MSPVNSCVHRAERLCQKKNPQVAKAGQLVRWSRDPCAPLGDPVPGDTAGPHRARVYGGKWALRLEHMYPPEKMPHVVVGWGGTAARLVRWKGPGGKPERGFRFGLLRPPQCLLTHTLHSPPTTGKSPSSLSRTVWSQTSEFMKT